MSSFLNELRLKQKSVPMSECLREPMVRSIKQIFLFDLVNDKTGRWFSRRKPMLGRGQLVNFDS